MQVQRVQNDNTYFQALKGFECSKNLKPIIGDAGEAIEQKLFNAFNENKYFQELCRRNDVWVSINPKHADFIKSGLNVEIKASKINNPNNERKENVIGYLSAKLYEIGDYVRIYDYSELSKEGHKLQLMDLVRDFYSHADDIIQNFINRYEFKAEIRHFFVKSNMDN